MKITTCVNTEQLVMKVQMKLHTSAPVRLALPADTVNIVS